MTPMALPFSLAGRVNVAGPSDAELVVSRLESALEALKGKRIQRSGAHLDFRGGYYIFRRVTRLNLLNIIGFGELGIEPTPGGVAIHYRIRFARWFWMVTLSVPIVIGLVVFGMVAPTAEAQARAALHTVAPFLMIATWLGLFGANVAYLRFRFPRWLGRAAATSERGVWLTGA